MGISLGRLMFRLHPHVWGRWRYYRRRMLHHSGEGYDYGMELWMRERRCLICGRLRIEREQQRRAEREYRGRPRWLPYAEQMPPRLPGQVPPQEADAP